MRSRLFVEGHRREPPHARAGYPLIHPRGGEARLNGRPDSAVEVSLSTVEKSGMIGKILAEYRIVEELDGQVGSQEFKAIGFDNQRPVAIRLFPSALSNDKPRLQALLESLRKISRLDQPGIPRLIGSGMNGGRAYIIMPFMTGGSLQERLEIGQISGADALTMLDKIANALDKAHDLGVVHGQLSPAHVMFDDRGQLQIIGLGLTPSLMDDRQPPAADSGHDHIAPEVGKGGQPTPASDQYSLAVLAFELLAGQPVHEALQAVAFTRSNAGDPPSAQPHLSPQVIQVLERALEDDPSRRFSGVSEMVRALHEAMRADGTNSRASNTATRATPSIIRRLGLGLVSLAFVALGCFALTLPAMAAAGWMGLDLASITNLFSDRQTGPGATAIRGESPFGLPDLSPSMPASTSSAPPQALLPTQAQLGGALGPTQVGLPIDDPSHADSAPKELDQPNGQTEQAVEGAPQPGGSSSSQNLATPTATPGAWLTPDPNDPQQSSPTPAPAQPTPTASGGCPIPSKQGCNGSVPSP